MMNMGNLNKMMKQVQQMQANMQKLQEELADRTVEATAGGGMVTVVVTGKQELKSIVIKPEAVDPDDVDMLQDLVLAAVNEGLRKAGEMAAAEMAKVTGGLKMPGMF
ncbi:MAG: YbaB/EbfC family nucleoid-associated protein [Bacillota bacterium]